MTPVQVERIAGYVKVFLALEVPEIEDLLLTADPISVSEYGGDTFAVFGQFCKANGDDVSLRAIVDSNGFSSLARAEYREDVVGSMHDFRPVPVSDAFCKAVGA